MPERWGFIDQIKGIERESYVIVAAVSYYKLRASADKIKLPPKTSPRDLVAAVDHVEATYLIRMWAAFEMGLRSYHLVRTGHDNIQAINLVDWTAGVKQGRAISENIREDVHKVRNYRNFLVHGNPAAPVNIEDGRRHLNTLMQCLPNLW